MAIKLSYTMFCWGEKRREVYKKKNKVFPFFGRGDKMGGNENGVGNFSPGLTNFNPWREMWDENVKKKEKRKHLLFCPLKPIWPIFIFYFLKRKLGNIVNLKKLYFSSTLSCVKMWTYFFFFWGEMDILILIVDINIK